MIGTRYDLEAIDNCFADVPLLGYWDSIKLTYESMGFTDPMTDSQRIEEYSYISEQLHKFIAKKHTELMKYRDSLQDMYDAVGYIIEGLAETSKDRKMLVYYMLRDSWLIGLRNTIWYTMMTPKEEDEDAE